MPFGSTLGHHDVTALLAAACAICRQRRIVIVYCLSHRLFQNISLGEWMYAMEHEGLRRSEEAFKIYALGVLLVLLTAMLRAYSQVSSNLTSARVRGLFF